MILAICTIPILPHSFLPQPEGFVNGDIVLIQGRLAFLSIEASGVRKPILIAIDFIEKKILWEIKTLGKIKEFIFNNKNQLKS
ncbi:hypothetical protein C5S36_05810 [Candidatus Methanophagaceae archaeon]|nr:hypothetical protein C5S36_05810 [Methanophagales archaeon]